MTVGQERSIVGVVDDDAHILQSLELLLESADHGVLVFRSAAALLGSGCLCRIDCLISDIDMPGMDGLALLREVEVIRPRLPTILITGYPKQLSRLPARPAALGVRVFTKPFEGRDLLAAVADAVCDARGDPA
jgi:FixJ family two-component response regulator